MKIAKKKGYIEIESPNLVGFFGRLVTGKNDTSAGALFPFIFVRDANFTPDWLINHELIHFRQEIEALFVGVFLISFIERVYARLFLKLDKEDRYLFTAMEQEAYLNMHNPDYLKERKLFSTLSLSLL